LQPVSNKQYFYHFERFLKKKVFLIEKLPFQEYFDEVSKQIQLNKGFKIILLGDKQSGKTSLAYALEDENSQTNLIEQLCDNEENESSNNGGAQANVNVETKLIDIHEFFIYNEQADSNISVTNRINQSWVTDQIFCFFRNLN
jgi:GTPase SAR1 family protein